MTRIKELEKLIKHYQDAYYNGNPEISDAEFDKLWDELTNLDPDNQILSKVGADKVFEKTLHIMPMGSQSKVTNKDDFLKWADKIKSPSYIVEHKLDGGSLEMQYQNGKLIKAVSRGDGTIGDDVTPNALRMNGVPKELPESWSGAVRGEVLMLKTTMNAYFKDNANCRNMANGIMKRKDDDSAKYLTVICYDAVPANVYDVEKKKVNKSQFKSPFNDEIDKIGWISRMGFNVVPYEEHTNPDDIVAYRENIIKTRDTLSYNIDGIVIKSRKIDPVDMLNHRPKKQIAFKFPLDEISSTLLSVEWSEKGTTYTPIGIIEPVEIAGTTVKRVSLANMNAIKKLNLKIGSKIAVVKRGEIIPKIEYVIDNPADCTEITAPDTCSACGAKLEVTGTKVYCPNIACSKQSFHRIEKWLAACGIDNIGPATLNDLYSYGLLKSIPDLYRLNEYDLVKNYQFGNKTATKIVANIGDHTKISVSDFIAGFDIEGIGKTMIDKLVEAGYNTYDKIKAASEAELSSVKGFGEKHAHVLCEGMNALSKEMEETKNFITFK